jgi:hypothetical protein
LVRGAQLSVTRGGCREISSQFPVPSCREISSQFPVLRYEFLDDGLGWETEPTIVAGNWLRLVWEVPFPWGVCNLLHRRTRRVQSLCMRM